MLKPEFRRPDIGIVISSQEHQHGTGISGYPFQLTLVKTGLTGPVKMLLHGVSVQNNCLVPFEHRANVIGAFESSPDDMVMEVR
jgi:hypothetical protein